MYMPAMKPMTATFHHTNLALAIPAFVIASRRFLGVL